MWIPRRETKISLIEKAEWSASRLPNKKYVFRKEAERRMMVLEKKGSILGVTKKSASESWPGDLNGPIKCG
ncbi:hypothetical protein QG37_07826 [Candidozyma auris]|uniref:Uncharacterized protein n=1 Tax=Candidozyma auris TaxID=498019 RepID=A0A0L0NNZ2_CANAR|nr:hypothetical protein QG37_07826 [[Candida] auris]